MKSVLILILLVSRFALAEPFVDANIMMGILGIYAGSQEEKGHTDDYPNIAWPEPTAAIEAAKECNSKGGYYWEKVDSNDKVSFVYYKYDEKTKETAISSIGKGGLYADSDLNEIYGAVGETIIAKKCLSKSDLQKFGRVTSRFPTKDFSMPPAHGFSSSNKRSNK
jgi:hypothetical protein